MWSRLELRRLLAAVLALAVMAAHAVAAPMPMPRADAYLLDPAAVCHASTDSADSAPAESAAHDCFLACQMAQAVAFLAAPAEMARSTVVAAVLLPPADAAPQPRRYRAGPTPRGPPAFV